MLRGGNAEPNGNSIGRGHGNWDYIGPYGGGLGFRV